MFGKLLRVGLLAVSGSVGAMEPRPSGPSTDGGFRHDGVLMSFEFARTHCIEFWNLKRGHDFGDLQDCAVSKFEEIATIEGQTYYFGHYCLIRGPTHVNCETQFASSRSYSKPDGLAIFTRQGASGEVRRRLQLLSDGR